MDWMRKCSKELSPYERKYNASLVFRLTDKILWLYLWPVVLLMWIYKLRVHLTKWPARLALKNDVSVRWFMDDWLCKQAKKAQWKFYR